MRLRHLFVLLFVSLVFAFGAMADYEPSAQRDTSYELLNGTVSTVLNYHIQGDEFTRRQLVIGAARAVAVDIETHPDFDYMDDAQRSTLVHVLRTRDFTTVDKLINLLDHFNVEIEHLDMDRVIDTACKGAVQATGDRFSAFMTMEEVQRLMGMMQEGENAHDPSLGMIPDRCEQGLQISFLRWGYAAMDAGMKVGDIITHIDGIAVTEMLPEALRPTLEADPGVERTFRIIREGWSAPIDITLTQKRNNMPSVLYTMLPGNIGYARALIFDMALGTNMENALSNLESQGMRALVLDLRYNPGGAINTCIEVASKFLPEGTLITSTRSRHPMMPDTEYRSGEAVQQPGLGGLLGGGGSAQMGPVRDIPMVCLVNESSASASEMLSGALFDNERCTVIGKTTWGKGIGQSVIPLNDMQHVIYITCMEYDLPSGRSIHHIGVTPHIEVDMPSFSATTSEWAVRLRCSGDLDTWVEANFEGHEEILRSLAGYGDVSIRQLPDVRTLMGHLNREEMRDREKMAALLYEARQAVRRHLEAIGERTLFDYKDDPQLQRGIVELCGLIDLDPSSVEEYQGLGD